MKKAILATLALLLSGAALASNGLWSSVTVTQIVAYTSEGYTGGLLQVQLSANSPTGPNCGSANRGWVTVDMTTPYGAYAAALLQAARLTQATITLGGAGSCGLYSTMETLGYVQE